MVEVKQNISYDAKCVIHPMFVRAFDWHQNHRPWMTLNGDTHCFAEKMRFGEPATKRLSMTQRQVSLKDVRWYKML